MVEDLYGQGLVGASADVAIEDPRRTTHTNFHNHTYLDEHDEN